MFWGKAAQLSLMSGAIGEDLLADAAFAHHENVRFAGSDLLDHFKQLAHPDILEDGLQLGLGALNPFLQALGLLPQLHRLLAKAPLLERLGDEAE
jgi:hypothetical protein